MILGASDASGHARSWPERIRLLFGVSVFWLALSMVSDGLTTLVLPTYLLETGDEASRAITLGLITFAGLLVGMLVQPLAGAWSDRIRPQWGRRGVLALGVLLLLGSLVALGLSRDLVGVLMAFIAVNVAASVAQAGQQGLLPDLVPAAWRGTASGFKMVMDVGGALVAFVLLGQLISGGELTPALVAIGIGVLVAFGLTIALVHEPS